jgi:hypothetical protein
MCVDRMQRKLDLLGKGMHSLQKICVRDSVSTNGFKYVKDSFCESAPSMILLGPLCRSTCCEEHMGPKVSLQKPWGYLSTSISTQVMPDMLVKVGWYRVKEVKATNHRSRIGPVCPWARARMTAVEYHGLLNV